ncbi:substrate-binding component of an ABC superfamily maltose/maltodextrin transporter [Lacticaseibacillus paracasei]|nr:substrate-binding component of an ABC superfamily maltose/maltodextrin transporter [Lacticaseibacillus paracasei]
MKLWKKILIGSATLVTVTLLAACSSKSTSSTSTDAKKVSGSVKLWVDTTQVPYYKKLWPSIFKSSATMITNS